MAAGADPDTTSTFNVALLRGQLTAGTTADADNWRQMAFVGGASGGEFIAFKNATLTGTLAYSLGGYLRRGGYGSSSQAHVTTDVFARIDDAIFRLPYEPGKRGATTWFKFVSFNTFGSGQEQLSAVTAYSHVLGASDVLASPKLFDQLAGQYATPSSGSNFIPNPSFELNNIGAVGPISQVGQPVCDSWYLYLNSTGFSTSRDTGTPDVGPNNLRMDIASGTSVAAGATTTCAATSAPIYVQAGQLLSINGDIFTFSTGGNGTNLQFNVYVGLNFYTAAGALIGNARAGINNATAGTGAYANYANNQLTVPAGTSYATAFVYLSVTNTGGTAQTVASWGVRFDNLFGQFVTSAGQVNYTTGEPVDSLKPATAGADNTANAATPPVINGGFDAMPVGYGWLPDSGTGWFTDTTGVTPGIGPNGARHTGGVGASTGAYRNLGLAPCGPGQVYKTQALIKAVGANGGCYVFISWCDAAGNEIGTTPGNAVTGTTTAGSYALGAAPAGTVNARTCMAVTGHTSGYYACDNVMCTQYPSSVDDVPDGSTYFRQAGTGRGVNIMPADWSLFLGTSAPASGNAPNLTLSQDTTGANLLGVAKNLKVTTGATAPTVLYLARSGQFTTIKPNAKWIVQVGGRCSLSGKQAYIQMVNGSGTTLASTSTFTFPNSAADVVSGVLDASAYGDVSAQLRIVFSGTWASGTALFISYVGLEEQNGANTTPSAFSPPSARTLDEQADGSSFGRTSQTDLVSNRIGLRVAGSGQGLGDQFNAPNSLTLAYGAVNSAASITATSAGAVSIAAFTVYLGSASVHYNAVSNAVTGLTVGSTYQIYCHDAANSGGTKTWLATTSLNTMMQAGDDIVLAGAIKIPSSGSSGGGGSTCPAQTSWVVRKTADGSEMVTAGSVRVGDELLLANGKWGLVSGSVAVLQPCVKVVGQHGSLTCSLTAPLGLLEGGAVVSTAATGRAIRARVDGVPGALEIVSVEALAEDIWTQHITVEDDFFWTGDSPGLLFSHHNRKVDLPP